MHMLMLSDDNFTLPESHLSLQFKIDCLEEYFDENDLVVNLDKMKVMMYRRGGQMSDDMKFVYKGQPIESVNEYVYLGIVQSYTGLFPKTCDDRKCKARLGLNSALAALCQSANIYAWKSRCKLFDSIVACCSNLVLVLP